MANSVTLKTCDLIMKGGVTSGIVYPRAITKLSRSYRFSSIGGTSAGSIAAVVAAAAEFARAGGKPSSFEQVDSLPEWLGGMAADGKHSNLFHLFQPKPELSGLYAVAMAGLGKKGLTRVIALAMQAFLSFPVASLFGTLPGLFLAAAEWKSGIQYVSTAVVILSTALVFLGSLIAVVAALFLQVKRIPDLDWGICSGMTEDGRCKSPALVPWLCSYIDQLAGMEPKKPLTFGDLEARGIKLRMITTNLTNGRPYSMPFNEHTHLFLEPEELKKFFPPYIVDWMKAHPGTRSTRDQEGQVESGRLLVFPDPADLPVIVAVRMSLSFPFLFCPVPLYGVDFGFGPVDQTSKQHFPEKCMFVDGGLTSNFPLNLFDRPLPRWPTFGINLRDIDDGRHKDKVFMPCKNSGGLEEWWTRFDECKGIAGVLRFFGLLFDTSRNWRDNLQLSVPGYRDRVVHIGLDPAREGGLNFDMTEETIAVLTDRGAQAGAAILARYAPTSENPPLPDCVVDLENQKWIRFRSLMELLEETVISVKGAFPYAEGGEPSYVDLLHKTANTSYNMGSPQRRYARELLDRIMDLAPAIDEARVAGHSFGTKAPKPEPELRVIPKF